MPQHSAHYFARPDTLKALLFAVLLKYFEIILQIMVYYFIGLNTSPTKCLLKNTVASRRLLAESLQPFC